MSETCFTVARGNLTVNVGRSLSLIISVNEWVWSVVGVVCDVNVVCGVNVVLE